MKVPIAIAVIGFVLCVAVMVVLGMVLGGRSAQEPEPEEPPRGPDIGRGVPGAPCATNRIGETFELDGVTYTCAGPKPYQWRELER